MPHHAVVLMFKEMTVVHEDAGVVRELLNELHALSGFI